ncbi:DNA-binding protein [Undibacterium sp. SXout11W]|uniref:DNA-binding protein n=1 Tax=Undibacterium sp. SXout11W TaxID=3413050 RepID=UPI003BF04E3D
MELIMARSGILFSDVCRAAETIQQSGNSPTVDNVRQAMGNTGSKSTIAPMLKHWKEKNHEQKKAINSGLPESILNAVRGAYELIKTETAIEISELNIQHQKELHDARENFAQIKHEAELLANQKEELTTLLSSASAEKVSLLQERQDDKLQIATLESENRGMLKRISDSEAQLKALHQQLNSSRIQFEHYQQASAAQRNEERQSFESRISRLEQDLKIAKRSNVELQNLSATQAAEIQQLTNSQFRMKDIAQVQLQELSTLDHLQQKTQFQLDEANASNDRLMQTLEVSQTKLNATQISLAVAMEKQEQCRQQLRQCELIMNKSEQERLELIKTILLQQQMAADNSNTSKTSTSE